MIPHVRPICGRLIRIFCRICGPKVALQEVAASVDKISHVITAVVSCHGEKETLYFRPESELENVIDLVFSFKKEKPCQKSTS